MHQIYLYNVSMEKYLYLKRKGKKKFWEKHLSWAELLKFILLYFILSFLLHTLVSQTTDNMNRIETTTNIQNVGQETVNCEYRTEDQGRKNK